MKTTTKTKKRKQYDVILHYLKEGKSINTADAFKLFGIIDLQGVIRNIRKTINVQDKWIKGTNQYGEHIKYKSYFIGAE